MDGQHLQPLQAANISHSSEGSEASQRRQVERQPDGLPRLPRHWSYADHDCPACSLGEGEAHKPGMASHAAAFAHATPMPHVPLRSIDMHGLALLESLRRPKRLPSWWGPKYEHKQHYFAELLETSGAHYAIIALTLLDLAVVVTELILSSIFSYHESMPHAVHTAEEALSWTSISILCLFAAELLAHLAVFGYHYFASSKWHMFDAVVIISSLVLELSLHDIAREVASLLIIFRLWRIMRIMHGVAEAMELNHETEIEHHHRLVHGLQMDLAVEHRRMRQLEQEVTALSAAAAGAGVNVSAILRLAAAAASLPEALLLEAEVESSRPSSLDV